jgi:hypothetical protein
MENEKLKLGLLRKDLSEEWKLSFFAIVLPLGIALSLLGLGLLGWQENNARKARNQIIQTLDEISQNPSVSVDGIAANNPKAIVEAIKTIANVSPHHSHPSDPFRIQIKDDRIAIELLIGRDSEIPNEYSVFVPKDRDSSVDQVGNEIGRVTSSAFEPYGRTGVGREVERPR